MPNGMDKKRRKLIFSQREGKAPLPERFELGKLSRQFRKNLWKVIETSISQCETDMEYEGGYWEVTFDDSDQGKFWEKFSYAYYFDILDKNHDEIHSSRFYEFRDSMREIILFGQYEKTLTIVEHMLRSPDIHDDLLNSIKETFIYTPYFIDSSEKPICIIPTTSAEMKENVARSLENISKSELIGTKSHLRNAMKELNNNNFAGSIRESMHAVEAATRKICPKHSKNFSSALDSLEKRELIDHACLKNAFKKLYNYTSDEEGIRHPLIEKESSAVGFDEAIFMYGACVSFIDYLSSKQSRMKE